MTEELNKELNKDAANETNTVAEAKQAYLDKLIKLYDKIFEMEQITDSEIGLAVTAHYMESAKKAFMRAERHEYVFIYNVGKLEKELFLQIRDDALNKGLEKIKPTKGYLSSFITTVILAEEISEEAKPLIEQHRDMKNLKRKKMGYVNQRISAVLFADNSVVYSKDCKELGVFLENFFTAEFENEAAEAAAEMPQTPENAEE